MALVSVLIPAFNAAATIGRTLASALAQSHCALDIVVIDDGSTDDTATIVADHAARDSRIRLVRQANAGLSTARNVAIDHAQGDFLAPLDADDLWHRDKIARQLACFEAGPAGLGLVYGWFRRIDAQDRVLAGSARPVVDGHVFHRHLAWNFISNGSSPLIRRAALGTLRYDPAMRDGCEDYLLQLQLARHWQFGCVPAFLTGYRRLPGSMSSHAARMIRAHLQLYDRIAADAPESARPIIARERARFEVQMARNRLRRGAIVGGVTMFATALARAPGTAIAALSATVRAAAIGGRDSPLDLFERYDADEADGEWVTRRAATRLDALARLDAAMAGEVARGPSGS